MDWLSDYINSIFGGEIWVLYAFVALLLTGILDILLTRLVNRLESKARKTSNYIDDSILEAVQKPLRVLIWVLGIAVSAIIIAEANHGPSLLQFVPEARKVGVLICVIWFCIRFIKRVEKNYLLHASRHKVKVDKTVIHAVAQLLTIATVITGLLVGMQMLGMPISGLLAFGSIGGAGIAFASKDLLANFFGGLVVYLDSPFKVGDWIRSPDKNIEGTVEYIGWRVTRIRTFDKRPLYVPNGNFLTISVENASRMTNRRIKTLVGLRYDDAGVLNKITDEIKTMLRQHPDIDTNQTLLVNLVEYAASSLNILIYTFTKTTDWVTFQNVQQDVFVKILEIIEQNGAECAFPTQTVHIPETITTQQGV